MCLDGGWGIGCVWAMVDGEKEGIWGGRRPYLEYVEMASTGFSRSKFEMKDSWGAPFVRVVVGRVDVDDEAIFGSWLGICVVGFD